MFLHLGGDVTVQTKDIIAIIDIGSKNISKITKEFLKTAEEEGFIKKTSEDKPKSVILAEINKKSRVFLSPISTTTLLKRSAFIEDISNV